MNDEKMIAALREGSQKAMGEIMGRYAKLLWPAAGAVLEGIGSAQDVEECVADAFVYLWEHPERYDPRRGKLKTWLSVIARSRAADRRRELTRRSAVPLEDEILGDNPDLAGELLREETRQALLEAVNALGEPAREILLRRYSYDQKPREIARALGLSVIQVNNRLYQAKQKLRKALSDER